MKAFEINNKDLEIKGIGTKKKEGSFRLSRVLVMILIAGLSFLVGSCIVAEPDYDYDHDYYEHHHHHEYYEHHDYDHDWDHHRDADK